MYSTRVRFYPVMSAAMPERLHAALAAYGVNPEHIQPVATGLINRTYLVTGENGPDFILQEVNSRFPPEINLDIDVVTRHLEQSGLLTPRLLPDRRGMVYYREGGRVWRLFTHIRGNVHERLEKPEMAGAAGAMLGRMHVALARLDYDLRTTLPLTHDTPRHASHLERALETKCSHARYAHIKPLGEAILARLGQLPALPATAGRMVHGDPKISNFIFSEDNREAICMVDFDTLNRTQVFLEIGDALRSWCNPSGEDTIDGRFRMAHCRAALEGYARHAGNLLTPEEWRAIPAATLTIYLELAARFCADALHEDCFSWDPARFGSHSEHSETRASGQLSAANSLMGQYAALTEAVSRIFR